MQHTATYSPEDNKLRIYPACRLDRETYERVRAAGFSWAPKQELFVAPAWSPAREDLALELCGEIDDEDTSLCERAEERAERFDDYSDKRATDATRAADAVASIADNIPLGQPILVGHHSERRARRDAEKIQNGMRKAVRMWETSKYWTSRAAGAIAAAKYKERPDVRARRIKGLESDERKMQKRIKECEALNKLWNADGLTLERAIAIANHDHVSRCFTLAEFPRTEHTYEGMISLWSALTDGICSAELARDVAVRVHTRTIDHAQRWLAHTQNRLAYERAMLAETGYTPPPKAATKAVLPLLNYKEESYELRNPYRTENLRLPRADMTKAELARLHSDYKGTRVSADGTHRVRVAMRFNGNHGICVVFLTDSKVHPKPGAEIVGDEAEKVAARVERAREKIERTVRARTEAVKRNAAIIGASAAVRDGRVDQASEAEPFEAMRQSLKAGVQVVSAPQLFPTPVKLAERMAQEADIQPGARVLEPSAGTGRLLFAIAAEEPSAHVTAIEVSRSLAQGLPRIAERIACADFLCCTADGYVSDLYKDAAPLGTFDRIVMNPPFRNAEDIKHIRHAAGMLAEGGRLVALCADGPRQREAFADAMYEPLPAGSFESEGTGVNVALVIIDR
jgi:16S rRNA G1207 methylase RsmC